MSSHTNSQWRCQPAGRGVLIKQARAEYHGDDQRQLHHSLGQQPGTGSVLREYAKRFTNRYDVVEPALFKVYPRTTTLEHDEMHLRC